MGYHVYVQYTACLTGIIVITKIVRKPDIHRVGSHRTKAKANASLAVKVGIDIRFRLMCTNLIKLLLTCHVHRVSS